MSPTSLSSCNWICENYRALIKVLAIYFGWEKKKRRLRKRKKKIKFRFLTSELTAFHDDDPHLNRIKISGMKNFSFILHKFIFSASPGKKIKREEKKKRKKEFGEMLGKLISK